MPEIYVSCYSVAKHLVKLPPLCFEDWLVNALELGEIVGTIFSFIIHKFLLATFSKVF